MVKVALEVKRPTQLNPRFTRIRNKTLNYTSLYLLGELKKYSPVDHGRLQGSWVIFRRDNDSRTVRSSAKYAKYVNRGTGCYGPFKQKIYPKNGKYLSFIYKGKRIAVPWTRGQKPQKFVEKSIESTERRIDEFLIRSAIETDTELGEK